MPIRFENLRNTPGGAIYDRAVRRTAWPVRMGVTSAVLIGVLPLLLVVIAALAVGAVVYIGCSLIARVGELFGIGTTPSPGPSPTSSQSSPPPPPPPQDPMRENVRVVSRP